ncbi:hypothetical protein [Microbacterium sp.]|uniref:hypothetical protein n=1 Tax=Microbacterium sp. TaxID=51671 RepID=UPI003A901601
MTIRPSRILRDRVAAKRKPRIARSASLDRRGLVLEGTRLPFFIGPDVEVTCLGSRLFSVGVSIFAEDVEVSTSRMPKGARVMFVNEAVGGAW